MTDEVSRETPLVPETARGVFSAALPTAEAYAALLAGAGTVRGLIGPREVPRLWDRHILNCAVIEALMARDAAVCDIGSGAGLPGLVLAIARPDLEVTLVEPLLRRTTFLAEAVSALGLGNVAVHRGRAEDLHGAQEFDVVTSRAVAPLDRLARWSLPLARQGGLVLAMKGSSAMAEVDECGAVIAELGGSEVTVETVGADILDPPVTVVRIVKNGVGAGSATRTSARRARGGKQR